MSGKQGIRELVVDGFRRMVVEDSFDNLTVLALCKRTSISRKTFYTYFNDKYDVLEAIIYEDILEPAEKLLPMLSNTNAIPTGPTSSVMLGENMYRSILNHKDFYTSLTAKGSSRAFARAIQKSSMRLHRTLAEMYGGSYDDKMRYACRFGAGAQAAIIIEWLRDGAKIDPHELATWMHEWSFANSCVGFESVTISEV